MSSRFNKDHICTRCGTPFPRCLSNDMLACVFCNCDMLDDLIAERVIAEIQRRGLQPDTDADWIKQHICIGHGADDACVTQWQEARKIALAASKEVDRKWRESSDEVQAELDQLHDDIEEHLPTYHHGPDDDEANARETIEYAGLHIKTLERKVELLQKALTEIRSIITANGCDCECDHCEEEHDEDCERCLACRIGKVFAP